MTGVTSGNSSGSVEELDVYGEVPQARFGHTITLVSKTKVVLFGGATGDTGKYSMTGETYLFNILTKTWQKLNGKIRFYTLHQYFITNYMNLTVFIYS